MQDVEITYFETGTKEVRKAEGELFFGDALLQDYTGLRYHDEEANERHLLIPSACIITIDCKGWFDEELYMVDIENMKASKMRAMMEMRKNNSRQMDERGFQ